MPRWQLDGETRPREREGRWQLDRVGQVDAFARGLGDSLSLSWGDELMGVGAGIGAVLTGGEFQPAMDRQVERSRANLAEARRDRPLSTGAGELTGYIVPGFGAAKVVRAGAGVGGRLLRAGATGAGFGGVSGAGAGETAEERLMGGGLGAAYGAGFGVGFQGVLGEAFPSAWELGGRWFSGATGAPTQGGRMGIAQTAREDLIATARNNPEITRAANAYVEANPGATFENGIAHVLQQASRRDPTLTTAEAFGMAGQGRLAAMARAPGQTGQAVEDFFTARARNQPDEVTAAVLGRAPASGDALEQQLREAWRTQGPALYNPILNAPLNAQRAHMAELLPQTALFQHRAVQAAWQRAGAMIADDIALGRLAPDAARRVTQRLHYTKVALDDMLADPTKLEPGIRNMNNASIQAARDQLLRRIERIIPGYREARGQMADIGAARRAVEAGRQAFTRQRFQSEEALARHIAAMSPGERPFFIAGAEDYLTNAIQVAGRDGKRNIASVLLNDRTQARMRAIYGDEAVGMISRLREISAKFDFGQRVRPTQGSITSNILMQAIPGVGGAGLGAANAQDDPIMGALAGGAIGFGLQAAARRAASSSLVRNMNRAGERQRDLLGRLYLTPVGDYPRMQTGLLSRATREARRRESRLRLRRTQGAAVAGTGGMGAYDPRREEE